MSVPRTSIPDPSLPHFWRDPPLRPSVVPSRPQSQSLAQKRLRRRPSFEQQRPLSVWTWRLDTNLQRSVCSRRISGRQGDRWSRRTVSRRDRKKDKKKEKGKEEKFTTTTYLPKPDEQMVYITVQFLWKPRFEIESGCVISVGWYAQDEQKKWKRTASLRGSLSVGCAILTGS